MPEVYGKANIPVFKKNSPLKLLAQILKFACEKMQE